MTEISIKKIEFPSDLSMIKETIHIRREVFGKEQGIPERDDLDGLDSGATHFVGYLNENSPVSCARVRFINGNAKLERIATLKELRGQGFGGQILNSLIGYCKEKDSKEIYFDAQVSAKGFYERFGFNQRGNIFDEVGIPHLEMFMQVRGENGN